MSDISLDVSDAAKWKSRGISFSLAGVADRAAIWDFVREHFLSEEPVIRSAKLMESGSIFSSELKKLVYEELVVKSTSGDTKLNISIIARDQSGEILGKQTTTKKQYLLINSKR